MSNILRAEVSIRGTRPCLWHVFGPDAIPLEKQERTGVAGNDPQEWRRTVSMTRDRQLYFQPSAIFGLIRDASRYTKKGRGSIQTAVSATLQIETDRILFTRGGLPLIVPEEPAPNDMEASVYLDVRSVKNPTTKSRNVRYRVAASPGWETSFSILWDKTMVSRSEIESVLRDASRFVGLSDARGIGFGRFTIERFDVTDA